MKKYILIFTAMVTLLAACSSNRMATNIEPKQANISIPAKGELVLWKNVTHNSFSVQFINENEKASCEIYKVTKAGKEKWINPSLLGSSKITISVPTDGYVYFKNFNTNALAISYKILED
jgi:hypothetical protein